MIAGSARVSDVVSEISLTPRPAAGYSGDASEPPSSPPDRRSEAVHRATDKFARSGGRRRHLTPALPSKGTARGSLRILPFGTPPPHTFDASFLAGIEHVLDEFKTNDELVLIDSPPLLRVGDALALTSHVDGLLVIGSLRTLRAPQLKELRRVIDDSPVDKLGFILTGAELEGGYEYLSRNQTRSRSANNEGIRPKGPLRPSKTPRSTSWLPSARLAPPARGDRICPIRT